MSGLVYAIDLHSEWGPDLSAVIDRHNPDHVILHTYGGFEASRHNDTMHRQTASVQAKGKTLGMYAWAFQAYSPEWTVIETLANFRSAAGHEPPVVHMDCEKYERDANGFDDPGPDVDWLLRAGPLIDSENLRKSVYVSPGYARERWGERAYELAEAGWLLWLAHWDRDPNLRSAELPLYGWSVEAGNVIGKQWAVELPGDETIDRDVFLAEYTIPGVWTPPRPEDCAAQLAGALQAIAHVSDILAPKAALSRRKKDRVAALREIETVRVQYVGPKPC